MNETVRLQGETRGQPTACCLLASSEVKEKEKKKRANRIQAKRLTVPRVVSKSTAGMRVVQIPQEQQEEE